MRTHKLVAFLFSAAVILTAGSAFAAPVMHAPLTHAGPPVTQTGPGARFPYPGPLHQVYGVIRAINGNMLTLQTRRGLVTVDATWAIAVQRVTPLFVPRPVIVRGVFAHNTLIANEVGHNLHTNPAEWGPDY